MPQGRNGAVHDRAALRHPLRRARLRAEPDGARGQRDQRPRPGHRHLLGRPDDVRLQARVRAWRRATSTRSSATSLVVIPGNHDSRNVGYVHFEDMFGERNSVLRARRRDRRRRRLDRARPRPRPDRPRPLPLDRGAVRRRRRPEDLRAPPPPAAGPRHGPRAQRRLRRRRLHRVPAARGRRPRPLGPQARALRVAAREPVRRQRRHGLLAAPAGQDAALLQRDRGHRPPRGRLAQVPVPRPGADHPVLDRDAARSRSTRRGSRTR